jgi:hypothetical protein
LDKIAKLPPSAPTPKTGQTRPRLVHFEDASRFYNRRFFLTLGKVLGAFTIDINSREPLAVVVVHGHLPVPVFAPPVPVEPCCFLSLVLLHFG